MRAGRHVSGAVGLGVALCLAASHAVAQSHALSIRTVETGTWAASIARMQRDLASERTSMHVIVEDDGVVVPCERYSLTFDAVGQAAFRIGRCDPATRATEVTLVSRTSLFDHDGPVPMPRTVALQAVEVQTTTATGSAGAAGGSELQCSLALRPFLENMETGTHVFLDPGRFAMHVLDTRVSARPGNVGWVLATGAGSTLTVSYDVVDTARGTVVLHDRATLSCTTGETHEEVVTPERAPYVPPPTPYVPPPAEPTYARHDAVEVEWHGTWYAAEILEVRGGDSFRIHYTGYGSSWDENVGRSRIRRHGGSSSSGSHASTSPPDPNRPHDYRWILGQVVGWGIGIPFTIGFVTTATSPGCDGSCTGGIVAGSIATGVFVIPMLIGSFVGIAEDFSNRNPRVTASLTPMDHGLGAAVVGTF